MKSPIKLIVGVFIGIIGLFAVMSTFFTVDSGEIMVYQNPATETIEAFNTTGFHMAMPFTSTTFAYNKYATVSLIGEGGEGSYVGHPMQVRFPDNYTGTVGATLRFELPSDPASIIELHKAFRSYDSVVNKLLVRTAQDVMLLAATQFTSEDFFQGGLPKYKADIIDFLNNGTPVLSKQRVEIHAAGAEEEALVVNGKTVKKRRQFAEIFVPVRDKNGKIQREEAPLKEYGIRVMQVTMGSTVPAEDLQKLLVRTKQIFAERRAIRAEQENERQARITAKLKGERAVEEAEQIALKTKKIAVVAAQQKVALAEEEKNRVLVEKDKELQSAQADLGVQRAKFAAAKLQAESEKVLGFAKAEVTKASYKARDNAITRLEIQRDMAVKVSKNMQGIEITMPQMVLGGGSNGTDSMSLMNTLISAQLAGKQLNN